jgi:hypothetical protein
MYKYSKRINIVFLILILVCSTSIAQIKAVTKKEKQFQGLINESKQDYGHKIRLDGCYSNITLGHISDSEAYAHFTISPSKWYEFPHHDTIHPLMHTHDPSDIERPVFFFNDGILGILNASGDTSILKAAINFPLIYNRKRNRYFNWGTYEIRDDTIYAIAFVTYGDYGIGMRITYFSGIIQDKNTIVNWREIPPYHQDPHRASSVHDIFEINKTRLPQTLEFVSYPDKNRIDSSRAWINGYKK